MVTQDQTTLQDLIDKMRNIQATYIGNTFKDMATQELLLNLASQVNLIQDILKLLVPKS